MVVNGLNVFLNEYNVKLPFPPALPQSHSAELSWQKRNQAQEVCVHFLANLALVHWARSSISFSSSHSSGISTEPGTGRYQGWPI